MENVVANILVYERLSAIALLRYASVYFGYYRKKKINKNVFKYLSVKSLLSSFV